MKDRHGVEMSMQMIVIIVILLIVTAIIIYLVVTNSGGFVRDTTSCTTKGGSCKTQCDPGESGSAFFTGGCDKGEICCKPSDSLLGNGEQ